MRRFNKYLYQPIPRFLAVTSIGTFTIAAVGLAMSDQEVATAQSNAGSNSQQPPISNLSGQPVPQVHTYPNANTLNSSTSPATQVVVSERQSVLVPRAIPVQQGNTSSANQIAYPGHSMTPVNEFMENGQAVTIYRPNQSGPAQALGIANTYGPSVFPNYPTHPDSTVARQQQLQREFFSNSDEQRKSEIKKELVSLLEEQFDNSVQAAEKQLDELETRLEKARTNLKTRVGKKEAIVEARADTLLGVRDELAWDYHVDIAAGGPIRFPPVPYPQSSIQQFPPPAVHSYANTPPVITQSPATFSPTATLPGTESRPAPTNSTPGMANLNIRGPGPMSPPSQSQDLRSSRQPAVDQVRVDSAANSIPARSESDSRIGMGTRVRMVRSTDSNGSDHSFDSSPREIDIAKIEKAADEIVQSINRAKETIIWLEANEKKSKDGPQKDIQTKCVEYLNELGPLLERVLMLHRIPRLRPEAIYGNGFVEKFWRIKDSADKIRELLDDQNDLSTNEIREKMEPFGINGDYAKWGIESDGDGFAFDFLPNALN